MAFTPFDQAAMRRALDLASRGRGFVEPNPLVGAVVAAGETLRSLAMRFYGDPAMADRIWEANRGRLRSPELLVPGMELTLP